MSLRVWLPLTKDLSNNGLSEYDIGMFRGTETYNANGKLGKCFYANGVNTIKVYKIIPDFYKYTGYSLCAWFYIEARNTVHSGSGIISAGNWDNQVLNLAVSDWSTDHYTKLRVSGTSWGYTYNYNFNLNTWYHAVVSSDGVKTYAYVNGTLIGDTVTGFLPSSIEGNDICIGGATYYNGMQFFGRINDVRIYDHCLSAKEVKEISKGLVAHYTLGDIGGCPNLLPYSKVSTANKNLLKTNILSSWNNLSITTIDGFDAYLYPTAQSSTWFSTGYWYKNMTANTTYTYSAYIYQDSSSSYSFNFTSLGHFQVYNSSSTASDKSHEDVVSARVYSPATIPPKTWTKISITFTTNTLAGSNFQVYPRYNIGANTFNLYFRDCKLELGNKATPWLPNSSDTEYTTMGYNDTTVYDSSGYNYHGTTKGTLTVDSNTPRYSVSTKFAASSGSFSHPNITLSQFTFSFWAKHTAANKMLMGSNASLTQLSDSWYWYGDNSFKYAGGEYYYQHNAGSAESLLGTWIHFVATYDGANITVYRNGVNEGSKSATGDKILQYLSIGNGYTSSIYWAGGWVSDFRLYTTCLSADDVKKLYNTPVSIANNGSMLTQGEFVEV